jgi:hypothetical protein
VKVLVALLVLMLGAFAWRCVSPFLQTDPEQDACTFGPVSNARYRELLAEAKRRDGTTWPKLRISGWFFPATPGEREGLQAGITRRIDDLTANMTSVYEKIAAMHAVARSLGAYHHGHGGKVTAANNFHFLDWPYVAPTFGYEIDVIAFHSLEPFIRTAGLFFTIGTSRTPMKPPQRPGKFRVTLLWPNWLDSNPRHGRGNWPPCPPVPPAVWGERFDAYVATLR